MNYTDVFRKVLLFWIVMGMVQLFCPNNTTAFSSENIDFDRIESIEINAVVSKVNVRDSYLIVGEKKVFLIEFKIGRKHYKTTFVNKYGDTSDITSLNALLWEGKRVLVKGFKLANGDIMAGIIKKIP